MKLNTYALRTTKEILRDPLHVAFGLGFPLVILVLLTAIQNNIPINLFAIEKLTPGISVFGLSFMTLFASVLVAKDRSSSLLCRLYTTPLKARDYILGYTLPLLPMGFIQTMICYSVAILLGMDMHIHVLYAILLSIPTSLFFISFCFYLCTYEYRSIHNSIYLQDAKRSISSLGENLWFFLSHALHDKIKSTLHECTFHLSVKIYFSEFRTIFLFT